MTSIVPFLCQCKTRLLTLRVLRVAKFPVKIYQIFLFGDHHEALMSSSLFLTSSLRTLKVELFKYVRQSAAGVCKVAFYVLPPSRPLAHLLAARQKTTRKNTRHAIPRLASKTKAPFFWGGGRRPRSLFASLTQTALSMCMFLFLEHFCTWLAKHQLAQQCPDLQRK